MITEPTPEDLDRIAGQWLRAQELVQPRDSLDESTADLSRIQETLAQGAIDPSRTYDLQCLGIAMGRVLASTVEGLDWATIDDEYGRDPTIRYQDTSLVINVLTMISKRVENGEQVDVREMYRLITDKVREVGGVVD